MKKLWMCLLFCLAFALPCMAEDALPQGVVDLCDARYPAYIIARHDGWGNETQGQYALVLTDGEDNILCLYRGKHERRTRGRAAALSSD